MAKIVSSDLAPSEAVHYSLGNVDFDLGGSGKKTFDTDDPDVIANALAHPWLDVQFPKTEVTGGVYVEQVDPKLDPLSRRFEGEIEDTALVVREPIQPTAIDAGEDQNEVVTTGPVAETLAAEDKADAVQSSNPNEVADEAVTTTDTTTKPSTASDTPKEG